MSEIYAKTTAKTRDEAIALAKRAKPCQRMSFAGYKWRNRETGEEGIVSWEEADKTRWRDVRI